MTMKTSESLETRLMTPAEVAAIFRVDVKTVTRWANAGKLTSIRTLGGHRRFREHEVLGLMQATLVPGPIPAQYSGKAS
jgi:excisionase family DNA binding protein